MRLLPKDATSHVQSLGFICCTRHVSANVCQKPFKAIGKLRISWHVKCVAHFRNHASILRLAVWRTTEPREKIRCFCQTISALFSSQTYPFFVVLLSQSQNRVLVLLQVVLTTAPTLTFDLTDDLRLQTATCYSQRAETSSTLLFSFDYRKWPAQTITTSFWGKQNIWCRATIGV